MNIPGFTAETSLYLTSGHYRTGRHRINSSASGSSIYPAVIEVGDEVIVIRDPWSPLTEPPIILPGGGAGNGPVEAGEGPKGKGKGGKGKDKPAPKRPVRRNPNMGRNCLGKEAGPDLFQAEVDCNAKSKKGELRTLRCFDNPDGSVDAVCCHMTPQGKITLCISDIEQVPP